MEGEQSLENYLDPGVSTPPSSKRVAALQWNNVEEEITLEKKGEKRKELLTNDERSCIYLTINGQRCGVGVCI